MEDDLKILKVEYLSNHWLDFTQIWNLGLRDQTKLYKCFKWRRPPMEDHRKILRVEYLSNHWLELTKIWNLRCADQTRLYKSFKWRQPPRTTFENTPLCPPKYSIVQVGTESSYFCDLGPHAKFRNSTTTFQNTPPFRPKCHSAGVGGSPNLF